MHPSHGLEPPADAAERRWRWCHAYFHPYHVRVLWGVAGQWLEERTPHLAPLVLYPEIGFVIWQGRPCRDQGTNAGAGAQEL